MSLYRIRTRKMSTFLILTLSVLCLVRTENVHKGVRGLKRSKRQDVEERWSWGFVDTEITTTHTSNNSSSRTPDLRTTTTLAPYISSSPTPKHSTTITPKPYVSTNPTPDNWTTTTPEPYISSSPTPEFRTTTTPEPYISSSPTPDHRTTTTPEPYISSSLTPEYMTTTTSEPPEAEFCKPYDPPLPDFSAPGKRISEAKCEEYIWRMKTRAELDERSKQCTRHQQCLPNRCPVMPAIGEHVALQGEYPHMGAVGWKAVGGTWVFKCGSSLISSKFLLTAAHCSRMSARDASVEDPVPKIVRLGDKNVADVFYNSQLPIDKEILKITKHPRYSASKEYNDIAIIELVDEITEFTKLIQPACLWTKFDTSSLGHKANLTGWGVIKSAGLQSSPELQVAEVDIIDSDVCARLLWPFCGLLWCRVQDGQVCAGKPAGGVDVCQGNSGGPLQVRVPLDVANQGTMHYVIGVKSFGSGCARSNKPGLYARVSQYIDWIEEIVWR